MSAQLLEHPAHERELEHHEIALQVGEARAGELGGVVHVDHRSRQLEVVAGREDGLPPAHAEAADPGLSHDPHELVLGARGGGGVGEVGQRQQRRLQLGLRLGELPRELLLGGA